MTKKSMQLVREISHLDQCNKDLRSVMLRFEKTTTELARRIDAGALMVDALQSVTGSIRLKELHTAQEAFQTARHRTRVAMFAVAIEQGSSLSEMGRALGISRQLASVLGAEAEELQPG